MEWARACVGGELLSVHPIIYEGCCRWPIWRPFPTTTLLNVLEFHAR